MKAIVNFDLTYCTYSSNYIFRVSSYLNRYSMLYIYHICMCVAWRRTVGDKLWESIKPSGFASERFKLHLSPTLAIDLRTPEDNNGLEPSLLIYQSDLCSAMLNHLEANFQRSSAKETAAESRST